VIVIRAEQMSAFAAAHAAAFGRRVAESLCRHGCPAAVELGDDALRARVEIGLRRARAYGITWERSLAAFVAWMFWIGPDFDRHPVVRRILTAEEIAPDERVELLVGLVPATVWESAREQSDPAAWRDGDRDGDDGS